MCTIGISRIFVSHKDAKVTKFIWFLCLLLLSDVDIHFRLLK